MSTNMKTLKNTIKFKIYVFLFLSSNTLIGQIKNINESDFILNDSVRYYDDNQNDLLSLKLDSLCTNCFDIVVCSHGVINSMVHFEIKDSLVNFHEYKVLSDSLILISKKKGYIKDIDFNKLSGYYQYYTDNNLHNSYFKDVTVYRNSELVSRILFDGVKKINSSLPSYYEIKPIILLISEVDKW